MTKKKRTKAPLDVRLYRAAKDLATSCGDNYGSEACDNGDFERYYSEAALVQVEKLLREFEETKGIK